VRRSDHVGAERPESLDGWTIEVGGLVKRPLSLTVAALEALGELIEVRTDLECAEGISTAGAVYHGIPLADALDAASPADDARYVTVQSGPYVAAFPRESLGREEAVLAVRRNGAPMTWEEGGPVRLVVTTGACFDTVKWITRVALERDSSTATALDFVRARHPLEPSDERGPQG
jgi:DMSO/TMAO reductase YedYZ molybdopterin-dependent catalytic subunit